MTHLEQAIRDAVEGGWEPYINHNKRKVWKVTGIKGKYFHFIGVKNEIDHEKIHVCEALLDPAFWQALGKAKNWKQDKPKVSFNTELGEMSTRVIYGGHMAQWHRFIDHLAEGKDIESFFASL